MLGDGSQRPGCEWAGRLLIDVLGHPAEALSIALSFQHTAHEHFQRPGVQLLQRHTALEEKRAVRLGSHGIKVLLPAYCRFSFRTKDVNDKAMDA